MTQDLDDIINNNWINVFPDPEGHWKIYCSLWLINVLAGQQKWGDKSLWNRQDVAIQAYLFIPALLLLCRTHCSANYGAWRVSSSRCYACRSRSATAAADRRWRRRSPWPQQGAQLWFSRHLWNKTSKIELLGIFTLGGHYFALRKLSFNPLSQIFDFYLEIMKS